MSTDTILLGLLGLAAVGFGTVVFGLGQLLAWGLRKLFLRRSTP